MAILLRTFPLFKDTTSFLILFFACSIPSVADTFDVLKNNFSNTKKQCKQGTLFEPYTKICAPVNDISHLYKPKSSTGHDKLDSNVNFASVFLPEPGGIGAGTYYSHGTHQALEHAVFHTKMFVQVDGLDSTASDWQLMTPATNHTDSSTEFVGIYASHLKEGWLGIFARPCTEAYPCPDGDTNNGWQAGWSWPFSTFQCNITEITDQGEHLQKVMHYANETIKLDQEVPPLWQNTIYLWNYCSKEWDLYWSHQYRENKRDCSVDGCYRWGPILETFGTQAEINELGYEDSILYHDGEWSPLLPEETDFVMPISPWLMPHIEPNRGYGAGNRFVMAPKRIKIDIKPLNKRNKINPRSRGNIWVAILSDKQFDPLQVDISTIRFGPNEASANRYRVRNVNKDGVGDLLVRFKVHETGITCEDSSLKLVADTFDDRSVSGTDFVRTVGCKFRKK